MPDPTRDYLQLLLNQYWFAPPVALWRAIELRILAHTTFARPILDLGCGDGLIAQVLFQGEPAIEVGFDPWFNQIRKAPDTDAYENVQQAVGDAMPYPDGYFGTVFSNSVLEHIADLGPVLAEAGRVLRPGGRFIATVPSDAFRYLLAGYQKRVAQGDVEAAQAYADDVDRWLEHHRYPTPEAWATMLDRADMRVVRTEYYMAADVTAMWDRANWTYGLRTGRISLYRWLVSPRLRQLGYQALVRRRIVQTLSKRWRQAYQTDVAPNAMGGGLLVIGEKVG